MNKFKWWIFNLPVLIIQRFLRLVLIYEALHPRLAGMLEEEKKKFKIRKHSGGKWTMLFVTMVYVIQWSPDKLGLKEKWELQTRKQMKKKSLIRKQLRKIVSQKSNNEK